MNRSALFLVLSLGFIQLAASADQSSTPCQLTNRTVAYKTFLKRHILEGAPSAGDEAGWEELLRSRKLCLRPTQSFLPEGERARVEAVCSPTGGKLFKGNLCISKQPFTFVTVRVDRDTCGIRRVDQENKHIILACEGLRGGCQPVHFEGNPDKITPQRHWPDCASTRISGRSTSLRPAGALVSILAVLVVGSLG